MKAHRFKTKLTTREEVEDEFFAEIANRVRLITKEKTNGFGVIPEIQFTQSLEGIKAIARIKLDLMKEWERKGRSIMFLKDNKDYYFMDLLEKSIYGKLRHQ